VIKAVLAANYLKGNLHARRANRFFLSTSISRGNGASFARLTKSAAGDKFGGW